MAVSIDWQPGDIFLDHYRVDRLVGTGGMGKVYRVEHRGWGMPLVVKVPRPELVHDVSHMISFERECETWTSLGHHPNIVSCYFVRRYEDVPLVFAEYVRMGSLHDWIASGRLYRGNRREVLARILDFAIQFAHGLGYAHARGMVHQDVKPANAMIAADGSLKVTDFGLARAHAAIGGGAARGRQPAGVTAAGMTPAYCSPEQASNGRLTAQSDLWSWGISVLEMFTGGCHWMSGVAARDVLKEFVQRQKAGETDGVRLPPELGMFLDTCFRSDPARRPSGMESVVSELQSIYAAVTGSIYPRILVEFTSDPSDPMTIANANNRAISQIELGEVDAAIELFKDTELDARAFGDLNPGTELQDLAYNQALLQIRTNPVYNVDYVPSLIPKRPNELRQDYLVGSLLLEAGRIEDAIDRLTRPAQRSSSFQGEALNARGIALLLAGETAPAVRSFESAHQLEPDRLEYVRNLAIARYYHGDTLAALRHFQRLSGSQRLDAADAIRFAAILSSAGQIERSGRLLRHLRTTGTPSAATLCTACEVGLGVQSFLPDVVPVADDVHECRQWVLEALHKEPDNVRAEVVRRRFPRRIVLRPKVMVKRGARVPPDPGEPEDVADRVVASYAPFQSAARWGALPSPVDIRIALVSTILPILTGIVVGGMLFQSSTLTETFGAAGPRIRFACWSALVMATAWIVLRRKAATSLTRGGAVLSMVGFAAVAAPTAVHDVFSRWQLNDMPSGTTNFLAACVALVLGVFVLREMPFRVLGSRYRAWGDYTRPVAVTREGQTTQTLGITAIARLTSVLGGGGAAGFASHGQTSIARYAVDRIGTSVARALPKVEAFWHRYRARSGLWHVLLLPQFVALAAADSAWIAFVPEAAMFEYAAWMLISQAVVWLTIPYWPRLFVPVNTVLVFAIAWAFVRHVMPTSAHQGVWVGILSAVFLALNANAWRRCPAFARLWRHKPPTHWRIDTLIDPLDLRRFAAPWRVIPVTSAAENR